jgi:hypothetical protein
MTQINNGIENLLNISKLFDIKRLLIFLYILNKFGIQSPTVLTFSQSTCKTGLAIVNNNSRIVLPYQFVFSHFGFFLVSFFRFNHQAGAKSEHIQQKGSCYQLITNKRRKLDTNNQGRKMPIDRFLRNMWKYFW